MGGKVTVACKSHNFPKMSGTGLMMLFFAGDLEYLSVSAVN